MTIFKKTIKWVVSLLILISAIVVSIIHILGNFYEVNDDVYRSGQLNKYNLEYYIKKHNINTIINLRGKSKKQVYLDERKIANEFNIVYVNYPISNSKFLDYKKTSEIVEILKNAKKPLLIHCAGGADRTSLVSALYQYTVAGESVEKSKEEFNIFYGYAPFFRGFVKAMGNSFDNYVQKVSQNNFKNKEE
ncbi:MAG: tyrosine-protein phosphatase [Arcobacter sp.]|nr:tyrosine-protein phosphatase [Arcobacter sp.]